MPKRNPKILGQVQDVFGGHWDVRRIRDTKHGFDLLFGSPEASPLGSYRGGLPRLIATQALRDFWEANRTRRDGVMFDLPAGRTTLKRVRRRLGFHCPKDVLNFWTKHIDDLDTLSTRECAARHDVGLYVIRGTRRRLLGKRTRDLGWWREPSRLEILRSSITLREKGEKLGISISQAKRLSDRAREESAQFLNG